MVAFELIPRLNKLYSDDEQWSTRRVAVIMDAMQTLTDRYQKMVATLQEKLANVPTVDDGPDA